jgi:prevent-host-death family protein
VIYIRYVQHQAGGKVAGRREDGTPADSAKGVDPEVSSGQVKPDISALANRVSYGHERDVLTSRGNPEAALVSMEDDERLRQEEAPARGKELPEREDRFASVDDSRSERASRL